MEQTIGKRVAALRKSRSMTQEQLAERVGVTAQAVSKWENDISCPDISLLPKLAEIFQVTTDSLLGVPERTELVPAEEKGRFHFNVGQEPEGEPDDDDRGFTFRFDMGKDELPWFAVAVLIFAVGLLLNRTLLAALGEASVWSLLWPSAVLAWGISGLWRKIDLWSIGLTGFGGYNLLVNMGILKGWSLTWKILLPILLVLWAISMLVEHFGKEKAPKGKTGSVWQDDDGRVSYDGAFGSETAVLEDPVFRGGSVDVSFGSFTLDLTNCQTMEPGTVLDIDISFGSMELKLPRHWRFQDNSDRAFASLSTHGAPNPDATELLLINSDLSFSSLDIRWP